jgi:hypothetical protein
LNISMSGHDLLPWAFHTASLIHNIFFNEPTSKRRNLKGWKNLVDISNLHWWCWDFLTYTVRVLTLRQG